MRFILILLALSVSASVPAPILAQTGGGGAPIIDLRVTGQVVPATAVPGEPIAFRFVIENLASSPAVLVRLHTTLGIATIKTPTDPAYQVPGLNSVFQELSSDWNCTTIAPPPVFPDPPVGFTCGLFSLAAGASEVVIIRGTVRPGVQGPIFNRMSVSAASFDPNPGNNDTGRVESVLGSPALSIPSHSSLSLTLLALLLSSVVVLRQRFDRS